MTGKRGKEVLFLGAVIAMAPLTAQAQTPPAVPASAATPLTLADATNAALTRTPAATAVQQQVVQAEARVAQARAALRSQITFTSTVSGSNGSVIQPPPSHESFGTLTNILSIPLMVGRKPRLAFAQADALLTAAQAQQNSARLSLAAQVSTAYFDLLRKQALLEIARDTQATAVRQADEAAKRFRAGDVPDLDVLRSQVPVASAEASVNQAENAVVVARQTLNSLTGHSLDDLIVTAEVAFPVPPALTLDEARKQARENSPEVRAAEATVQANTLTRQIAGRSQEPTYALQASDTRSNDQTGFSRLNSLEATVTIPLGGGALAKAQTREADALLAQSQAQRETARRTAEASVSAAYLNAQSSLRQIASAQTARDIAQTVQEKSRRGYTAGLFPLTDVLNAQSALTQARIAYTQAVYEAAVAAAALQNALGILPGENRP